MSKARSSIGHFARIPLHVARADVSETAKGLWREFAFLSSPEVPTFWVRQETFAKKLNKSVKTIQRALKELAAVGLIKFTGWMHGRYKTYILAWQKFFAEDGQNSPTTSDTNVSCPETPVTEDVGQECLTIIREEKKSSKQNTSFPERLAEQVQKWKERYQCLDGKNGRPTLKECIDQAMSHKSRHNYDNPITFLEGWLRKAAGDWMVRYQQELAAARSTPESRRAYEQRRAEVLNENWDDFWQRKLERDQKCEQERLQRIALGM